MSDLLPLFPLGTVLYPGMVLPLHIFEERYRQLMRDLLARPEPRELGVIAIREGRETGVDGVTALYEIGCVAELRAAEEHEDGTFEIVTVGTQRFRVGRLDQAAAYLRAEVELIPDAPDATPAEQARLSFRTYLDALVEQGGATVRIQELPSESVLLSYVIAAAMIIDLSEHQALLAEPDAASRLAAERVLMSRETAMLRATTSRPVPDLRYTPYSPN
jgi:uncharacterized protein